MMTGGGIEADNSLSSPKRGDGIADLKNGRNCPKSHTIRERKVPLSRSPVALVIPLEKLG
jgi:hypothetical protein